MEYDLDLFGRELTQRLKWLLSELKRLTQENARLLNENKELREEVTLARLHGELGPESDLPPDFLTEPPAEPMLSPEALQFYRDLPEKINFTDFFRYAELAGFSSTRARELMLSFFRQELLEQRGRRLEKSDVAKAGLRRQPQDA